MATLTCDRCGTVLPEDARFCPNCGAPVALAMTSERRVVTVLFADLAGSTELASHLDAERFREVIAAFFKMVSTELASLRGRAEKFVGDAVMAVWGIPHVHDDDAVRAVRAGLIIRDRTARLGEELELDVPLEVRVGINSGAVATGSGPADQLLVSGMPVNLAARLQQAATPGEILVGETTRQLTQDEVTFGEPRKIEAKGFGEPIEAAPVVSLSTRSSRRTIPLVNRRRELEMLRNTFERGQETGRPHMVTVLGEPGIGKSRLVDEFVATVPEGTTVLKGRANEFEEDPTFAPIAEMVRRELGVEREAPPAEVKERLDEIVSECCPTSEVDQVVARIGLALGLGEDSREGHRYRAAEIRAGFVSFVAGLARRGPAVLVFEDIHLSPPPLLDLVEEITRQAKRVPLMVICLARDHLLDTRPAWGGGMADAVMLRLDALDPTDAAELASAAGESLDEDTARRVAAHAGGNPFFIIETTGMMLQRHAEHVAGVLHSHILPPSVQAVVASRIDHLSEPARDLVRKTSVFAMSTFSTEDIRLITEPKEELLEELEDAELLVRDPERPDQWRFRHETLREVAYQSLPKRERLRLHVAVADGLSAGEEGRFPQAVAYHLAEAAEASLDLDPRDRSLSDRAVKALTRAGDLSRWRMESRTASELYQRALSLAGPREEWAVREARVLSGMGEAHYWLGEFEAAESALRRALEAGDGDAWTRTHASRFLGDITLNGHGDVEDAQKLFDQALASARELDDPYARARTLLMAGWAPFWTDDLGSARAMFEEALSVARSNPDGDRWAEARALTSLSSVISPEGDEAECLALAEQALAIGRDMGDPFTVAVAQGYIGNSLRRMWRLDEAMAPTDSSVRGFRDLGAKWELADALGSRGTIHRFTGQLKQAESDLREALRLCRELGERNLVVWTWAELVRTLLTAGEVDKAREVLDDATVPPGAEPSSHSSFLAVEALMALAEGRTEEARDAARRLFELERMGLRNHAASLTWWAGRLFGPDLVGGEDEMERARQTLEAANWIQAIKEPDMLGLPIATPATIPPA